MHYCHGRRRNDPNRTLCHERISVDPAIMVGKPVVVGTRIPVARVLESLAVQPDLTELFAAYPRLTGDDVRACLAYAWQAVAAQRGRRRADKRRTPADVSA